MSVDVQRPSVRDDLASIPVYSTAAAKGRVRWVASSNEAGLPPSPAAQAAFRDACVRGNRYPSMLGEELVAALAATHDIPAAHVVVGGGSLALLQQALLAFTGPASEVVFAWRSYEAYPIMVRIAGATPVSIPLDAEHRHDLASMVRAITPATRVVLICNPNNPTGTTVDDDTLRQAIADIPPDVLVILDEAYREFAGDGIDAARLIAEHPNVVVTRTFSKAYALAGLRAGYLLADEAIARGIRSVAPPFGLSAPAEAAAVAALGDRDHLARVVQHAVAGREFLKHELGHRGLVSPPSLANFVWLPLAEHAAAFEQHCTRHGVSVRCMPGEGVRVTVGCRDAELAVLHAAETFSAEEPASRIPR